MTFRALWMALAISGDGICAFAQSQPTTPDIDDLGRHWAHIAYQIPDRNLQARLAADLATQAAGLARQYPERAEPLVWQAFAIATEAEAKGGLEALSLANTVRLLLLRAERLNPDPFGDGAVYTALASLYARTPPFPVSFGDPRQASAYFAKALAINPTGVDANVAYAEFLLGRNDTRGAVKALERGLSAPSRALPLPAADRAIRTKAKLLLQTAMSKVATGGGL